MQRSAVVLLSGGLDSATTLAIARSDGYRRYALTVDYGQRHRFELEAAKRVASSLQVERHATLVLDLAQFGGSALTGDADVPKQRSDEEIAAGIPATYVPARNTVFLSLALAWAEALGCFDLFIGVNAVDYSGYPDCRPEFIRAFEQLANLATKSGVEGQGTWRIHTPLLTLRKAEIVRRGHELGVDFSLTRTCYDPSADGVACGQCDACLLRKKGFQEAGLADPLPYLTD